MYVSPNKPKARFHKLLKMGKIYMSIYCYLCEYIHVFLAHIY